MLFGNGNVQWYATLQFQKVKCLDPHLENDHHDNSDVLSINFF